MKPRPTACHRCGMLLYLFLLHAKRCRRTLSLFLPLRSSFCPSQRKRSAHGSTRQLLTHRPHANGPASQTPSPRSVASLYSSRATRARPPHLLSVLRLALDAAGPRDPHATARMPSACPMARTPKNTSRSTCRSSPWNPSLGAIKPHGAAPFCINPIAAVHLSPRAASTCAFLCRRSREEEKQRNREMSRRVREIKEGRKERSRGCRSTIEGEAADGCVLEAGAGRRKT
ncbi:unnamed protein product [Urochloa humidicola]